MEMYVVTVRWVNTGSSAWRVLPGHEQCYRNHLLPARFAPGQPSGRPWFAPRAIPTCLALFGGLGYRNKPTRSASDSHLCLADSIRLAAHLRSPLVLSIGRSPAQLPNQAAGRSTDTNGSLSSVVPSVRSLLLQPFLVKRRVDVGEKVFDKLQVGLWVTDLARV